MIVYESEIGWIEETYIYTMHTNEDFKYSRDMLKKMLEITKDKNEVLSILPDDKFVRFFRKHYNLECIDSNTRLYKFTRK